MCGIAGYIGKKQNVNQTLLSILEKLEYRGYDSAGLASLCDGELFYKRALGELANLKSKIPKLEHSCGGLGIAHTRWATHGKPSLKNAHPHKVGSVYVVHNGIIENYKELKEELAKDGFKPKSDTDTELIAALVQKYKKENKDLKDTFKAALSRLRGAFAILLFDADEPTRLLAARLSSPLVLGLADDGEYFLASDALAFSGLAKRVVYLNDFELLDIQKDFYKLENFKNGKSLKAKSIELKELQKKVSKSGFDSYMLKEIYEQPESVSASMQGRIDKKTYEAVLGGLADYKEELKSASKIHFVASGTSFHAALASKNLFEDLLGLPTRLVYASEANPKRKLLPRGAVAFFLSPSGETADTLSALEKYKKQGVLCLGVVNTVASSIARKTHAGVYNHAGPEISVASTKAFSSQIVVLSLIAAFMAQLKEDAKAKKEAKKLLRALSKLPKQIEASLKDADSFARRAAKSAKDKKSIFFLSRGELVALAYEGALKAKEISYIHAEGYPAGELKHGPIALLEKGFPVFFALQEGALYEKLLSNMQETKARGAKIFAVGLKSMQEAQKLGDIFITVPKTHKYLQSILHAVPMQLFAYHLAKLRGHNVDKPRNLAKSVTVE